MAPQLLPDHRLSKLVSPWILTSFPWSVSKNVSSELSPEWKTTGYKENLTKSFLAAAPAAKKISCSLARPKNDLSCSCGIPDLGNSSLNISNQVQSKQIISPRIWPHLPSYFLPSPSYPNTDASQSNFYKLKMMENLFAKWWTRSNHNMLQKPNPLPCQRCDLSAQANFQTNCIQSSYQIPIGISKQPENYYKQPLLNFFPQQSNVFSVQNKSCGELNHPTSPNCIGSNVGSLASSSGDSSETSSPFENAETRPSESVEQSKTLLYLKQTFFQSEKKQNSHRCNVSKNTVD